MFATGGHLQTLFVCCARLWEAWWADRINLSLPRSKEPYGPEQDEAALYLGLSLSPRASQDLLLREDLRV